jgi:GT2 family glycosyltransferase
VRVAVVVLSVDEAERLRTCLPAVADDADDLVVVDDACTDDTAAVARAHGARLVALERRVSYAAAVNAGLAATRDADAVLLLNADCVLAPGAVPALAARLADPAVGAVAPKLLRATRPDRVDAAGMTIDRRRRNDVVGHGAPAGAYARAAEVFGPDGACGLWRRATLDDVAPDGEVLDPGLALWTTDADLCWRARLRGWRAVYEPAAVGHHVRFFGPSTRASVPAAHRRLQLRNRLLMLAKDEGGATLARDLPHLVAYELLALVYALAAERALLGAYADAWRALPAARRRRRAVRARVRAVPPFGLEPPR